MQAKYIGDISRSTVELVEIDSFAGKSFEEKLRLAERMVENKKSLRLFDEKKEMIGNVELDEKSAGIYLMELQKTLIEKEAELNRREQELNERESQVSEKESNTKVEKITPDESGKNKDAGASKTAGKAKKIAWKLKTF